MNLYALTFRRFWWVLALGLFAGVAAGILSAYHVKLGVPPTLEARSKPTYIATAQLLVTSADASHLRTSVQQPSVVPSTGGNANTASPETRVLINAANLYPLLIESDEVAQRRAREYGLLPGTVTARGIYAFASPQRFELSSVPVIEVAGSADKPALAMQITRATVATFADFISDKQRAARVTAKERIVLEPLKMPNAAVSVGGTSFALPALLLLTVFAGSCALAILLGRLFPVYPAVRVQPAEQFEPAVRQSKTAV